MPIVPSGKRRIMEAQSTLDMGNQWGMPEAGMPQEESPVQDQFAGQPVQTDVQLEDTLPQQKSEGGEGLREYIMKKLQGYGYPPRRLEQFSDEFVEEELFPGGARNVTITIPDRYYGTQKNLSDSDLQQMIEEIQSKFGLVLTSAKRKAKKAEMEFTAQPKKQKGEGEAAVKKDDLDEIFGAPEGTKAKKGGEKTAQTASELITSNRSNIFEKLLATLPKAKQEEIKSQSNMRTSILNALFEEK